MFSDYDLDLDFLTYLDLEPWSHIFYTAPDPED